MATVSTLLLMKPLFSALPAGHRNGTLVLNTFHHDYQDDNVKKTSFGRVMTSRRIFRNVRYAAEGQQSDGIFAAADGTYKLHFGNWVLVAFGTYRSQYTTAREYSKSFVPFAYMFVRTKHEFAYTQLFATVVNYAKSFFAIELDVTYGSLDHADYIANAYEAVWPGITLLDCYPHVSRKCREKIGLLIPTPAQSAQEYYHGNVNIRQMHLARSPEEFDAISSKCLNQWGNDGQRSYADWFKKVYLADRWARWYATSGTPGVVPSQNPLESHNGVVKKCGVNAKRVKTGVMLNDSIPGILNHAARDPPKSPFGHYCAGPIPSDIIAQATKHVVEGAHFRKYKSVNGKRYTRSILFNAMEYMANKTRISGVKVTASRVNRYLNAKQGNVPDNVSVNAINLEYLSLHEVEFLNPEESSDFCLAVQPVISVDKMKEIRSRYRCDCKMFWTTGWICSHVVATMDLAKQFKLEVAMASLPVRKVSGGQRKVPGALYRDAPDNRTFSKPNLLKRLQDQPFYPYGWKIAEDFIFEEDGKEWSEYVIGVIDRHRAVKLGSGVIYEWKVVFCDGNEKYYECEQLVDLLLSSRRWGLDITSSATLNSSNVDTTNSLVPDNHNFGTTTANNTTPTELVQ